MSYICEVKKASPSKGVIAQEFPYLQIAKEYEDAMPEFALRLQVKAGLTGYAQVYGKYNTTPYDKVQMDLIYVARQSFMEDIRLMLMTFKILFVPSSTEGVSANQRTAQRTSGENGSKD